LKDALAGDYIKTMVHLYQESGVALAKSTSETGVSEKISGAPSLYSPSIDAIFDVIGETGAVASFTVQYPV
jgi:hypothetical protein